jgi:regulator of RNase E activity RraA
MIEPKYTTYDKGLIEEYRRTPTTDISDALTRLNLQAVRMWGVLPLVPFEEDEPHMAGPAVTIRFLPCFYKEMYQESEYKKTKIVEAAPPGSITAVEAGYGQLTVQGELNAMTCIRAKHAGSVGEGSIRDAPSLRKLNLPIFYTKSPIGEHMASYVGYAYCAAAYIPIQICGALVRQGDLIVGDNHGVVVVPAQFADQILEYAKEIGDLEERMREKVRNDETWENIYRTDHKSKYILK